MPAIKMEKFGGMLPAWDPHLLPDGQAASAINGYLFSGALTGWRTPKLLRNLNNSAAGFAYRIPVVTKGTASGTLTFVSQPNAGDQARVGELTYTFVADLASLVTPYTVLIGAAKADTELNLVNALTLDQGLNVNQGVTYGTGTSPNPDVAQASPGITPIYSVAVIATGVYVPAADIGAAYNTTVTTETTGGARLSWGATTMTGGINSTFDPSITGSAIWLEFNDPDTSVVRSPVVNDQYNRYYMASASLPPKYNTYDRIAAGQAPWLLGINPPGCAPEVSVVGGTNQATLGLSTATSTNIYTPGGNMLWVTQITPTGGMSLNDVEIMPQTINATANFVSVLYADNQGVPSQLIATGALVVGCTAGTPIVSAFVNPPPLTKDVPYWIGIFGDTDGIAFQLADDLANQPGYSMAATFLNGAPAEFTQTTAGSTQAVKITDATGTTITLDTPTSDIVYQYDILQIGAGVGGLPGGGLIGCSADTPAGSTIIPVTIIPGNALPEVGLTVTDLTYPVSIVGPAVAAPGTQPDVQMWADLTTTSVIEARAYLYTWLTAYNEESAPSPTTLVNGWSNGAWSITIWAPEPDDMGVDRNIKTARIYRTVPGTSGQTVFYWVCDVDIAANKVSNVTTAQGVLNGTAVMSGPGTVTDTLGDDQVALNLQLPSTTWFPPPEGLEGIYAMPNGMTVGFRDNEIWFSEPYYPHAWPPGYVITTEFPIIGLGVSGFSVIACTGGTPYIATGVAPSSMSLQKLPLAEPCLSRGSILGTATGVYYPSQKGLIEVNPSGGATNTTELWITRENWAQLTPQKNVRAVLQSSCYFAFGSVNGSDHTVAQQGYTIELNAGDTASFTIWPQPGGHRVGFGQLTAPYAYDVVNLYNDPWTGITCLIQNGAIYYYDFTDPAPLIQPYTWESKIYQMRAKEDFSAMRVFFTVPPNTPPQNPIRNEAATADASWNTLQTGQYGIIYVYGDGNLVTTRELRSNGELLRIASGQKYEQWQWVIKARVLISNIQAAPTVKELRNV